MKYVKQLTITTMACAALMAFASTASATHLSDPTHSVLPKGTVIKASTSSAVLEDTPGFIRNSCESSVEVITTNEGGTGVEVTGDITSLTWSGCTHPTKTLANGSLSVAVGTSPNGTVSGSGTEVETEVAGGGVCHYATLSVIGSIHGAATNTSHALLTVNTVIKRLKTTSGFCPESGRWTTTYTVTSPVGLKVTK